MKTQPALHQPRNPTLSSQRPTLTLTLEDGTQLTGESFGAHTETAGEVVFNTGMVGYPESFTDPSYAGQILVLTYPLIGNYGIPSAETSSSNLPPFFESEKIRISAVIVSEYSKQPHHWQAQKTLGQWLQDNGIPGITGIDTRMLTEHLRTKGALLGIITKNPDEKIPFYDPNRENMVAKVSSRKITVYGEGEKHIALVDCGMKYNILRNFLARGIKVTRVPWNHNIWEMKTKFDGVFFSNGPGDPALMKETVEIMKKGIEQNVPTFGICLGSQIMGIAAGGKTYKLKFGHRSQNQPCIDVETGRCYITSQNHGYAVDGKSMNKDWKVWMVNANDGSVEGLKHKKRPFFSVQYHPEASPGPNDSQFLFDDFVTCMKDAKMTR